jgi:hypothetical protein
MNKTYFTMYDSDIDSDYTNFTRLSPARDTARAWSQSEWYGVLSDDATYCSIAVYELTYDDELPWVLDEEWSLWDELGSDRLKQLEF